MDFVTFAMVFKNGYQCSVINVVMVTGVFTF